MIAKHLTDAMKGVEAWPSEAQDELAGYAAEIEAGLSGGVYHATDDELAGINRGIASARAGRLASEQDVAAVFSKYRPA